MPAQRNILSRHSGWAENGLCQHPYDAQPGSGRRLLARQACDTKGRIEIG
jgi:hypothetical protein